MVSRSIVELREIVAHWRKHDNRVALVAAMGALHQGHLRLIEVAREHADRVVVSIFVNPSQFAPDEDFETYPRTFDRDVEHCRSLGVELIFSPTTTEMYPSPFQTRIQVQGLGQGLCGESRPHFFDGVAIVVAKLLNIVQADIAIFGEKDYQQLQVIRRLAQDLNIATEIVGVPTVREPDGLAMSSRNAYLTPSQRAAAVSIHDALCRARVRIAAGARDPKNVLKAIEISIEGAGGRLDYAQIVDPHNLIVIEEITTEVRLVVAAYFGETRLIDNMAAQP